MTTEELTDSKLEKVLAALDVNWQAEMEGHWTYQTLADRDVDPVRAQVLRHLAGAEWEHAALSAGHIRELKAHSQFTKAVNTAMLTHWLKGVPEDDAQHMVDHIASDPDQLLRALADERLGSSEESLSNPLVSASSGALSTAIGAAIPIIPFFFLTGLDAVIAAAIVSLAAHFAVGAAKSLITVRSWWSSGFEMTVVGAVEGAVTYGIGILLGKGGM